MNTHQLTNHMRMQASLAQGAISVSKKGIITNFNPNDWAVKVLLQPEEVLTQEIPLGAPWVGDGWGLFAAPSIGDECLVVSVEGSYNNGFACLLNFNNDERPLPVKSGEFWLVHKTGSFLKLTNNGNLSINGHAEINVTAPTLNITVNGNVALNASGSVSATANLFELTGDTKIDGNLVVSGSISDLNGTKGSIGNIRDTYNSHTHGGVETGSGNTGTPSTPL